jgi:Tol biopolymer transport system component
MIVEGASSAFVPIMELLDMGKEAPSRDTPRVRRIINRLAPSVAMTDKSLSRAAILDQLGKIVSSRLFENAGRSRTLLEYLVQEVVSDRADRLKEYTIGSDALGRGESFDPRTDTIVRAEASRLRSRLERYYAAEGLRDPLLIVLPKGSYILEFRQREPQAPAAVTSVSESGSRISPWVFGIVAAVCRAGFGLWIRSGFSKPAEPPSFTFDVELKVPGIVRSQVGTDVIISPDGTRLVFVSQGQDGVSQLNVRRVDRAEITQLPGTEGARAQFLSPDGRWVGFWAGGKIKKTALDGGSPVVLCDAPDLHGASWTEDNFILAAFGGNKLWRIPASGGAPSVIPVVADPALRVIAPQILPGNQTILFTTVGVPGADQASIEAFSLATGKTKVVVQNGTYGKYLSTGHLIYIRQGTLYAVAFDLNRLEVRGNPAPVVEDISYDSNFGYAQLDVSRTGTLVYRSNGIAILQWIDDTGRTEPILAKPSHSVWPRVSPDGQRIALTTIEGGETAVWIHDLKTGQAAQAATGVRYYSLWSPDGRHLVLGGGKGLSWIRAGQTGAPQPLTEGGIQVPVSFNRDGTRLAYYSIGAGTHFDLWTVPIQSSDDGLRSGRPDLFLQTSAIETYPSFSPDGRWMPTLPANRERWRSTFERSRIAGERSESRLEEEAFPAGRRRPASFSTVAMTTVFSWRPIIRRAVNSASKTFGSGRLRDSSIRESLNHFASSGEFVGDGERQRAVLVRNWWNLRHVESNDLC